MGIISMIIRVGIVYGCIGTIVYNETHNITYTASAILATYLFIPFFEKIFKFKVL